MPLEPTCPRCGERIPFDETRCPNCSRRTKRPYPLALLITVLVLVAAALFVLTHFAAASFETKQAQLAQQWFERGELEFRSARVLPAIDDYRNALAYSHQNSRYRLRLAQALEGAGRLREARAYLLALWDEQPGDGNVNLQLARLAARDADENNAVRYYQGAIYGIWNEDPEQQRRNARMELIDFLVDRQRTRRAEAELIQLSVDLPKDPQV
ncbi:MAG TPA: tetratricopeptide repeat protein, partial [Terriglobales bacterium]|nr:tetratricopeptide repeat protein [Terriglobales bacterium]